MATYNLRQWFITDDGSPYIAPELRSPRLVGYRDDDPKQIITSSIVKAEGRTITTYSGSVYILQDIEPGYFQWLQDNNIPYHEDNPITLKGGSK